MLPEVGDSYTLIEDNQGAISMAHNLISNSNSKHIDVRYHFIRR
ncbi:unnamed protein product [Sphacelaria rigidula]